MWLNRYHSKFIKMRNTVLKVLHSAALGGQVPKGTLGTGGLRYLESLGCALEDWGNPKTGG